MFKEQFLIHPAYRNLNHGSFGTYPRAIQTVHRQLQDEAEARPDLFIRRTHPQRLDEARQAVASLLNAPVGECVFVKNATTGINTVLHNLDFHPGDVVIYFNTVYGAVEKSLVAQFEKSPLQGHKITYEFPITPDELLHRFHSAVHDLRKQNLNPRLAVFDTIVSNPGFRFPFERLIVACRDLHVLSLVDGAHGIGHIQLDLTTLNPDFFTSNCHKWLFTPRSCAVLYVPVRHQHLIRTTVPTSWGFIPLPDSPATASSTIMRENEKNPKKSAFESLFEFVATADDTPYLCVPAALQFRRDVCGGEERIYEYIETLANEGADIVASVLGTEVLQEPGLKAGQRSEFRRCGMGNVRLPVRVVDPEDSDGKQAEGQVILSSQVLAIQHWFEDQLLYRYQTFVPVFVHGGWLWVRLCAQIYLDRSDFEWVACVLKDLCKRMSSGPLSSL
ncbi:hypothetical protein EYZ11_008492 [Aspergillus tanneri]|uniref:Aminotransferase class V domain-containing protein n=1 Tax=Aspergillus tanneri TaxID=1220188 RepID=A0A4V3UNP9_9EURO|nr:uncharacterized protein ATNIH1004_008360 [Aspergillus tanneri]KAA8644161.1 hypothetical protein ATNIH1004_008360 [Aspergillus tanneri]THC92054.1 hypothetical protein EYZ11_008492 [Aspergillus tanneri]